MNRGTLSSGSITSSTYSQDWTGLDALGNWAGFSQDSNGDASGGVLSQTRTHNAANEITGITGGSWATTGYDAAGNMTSMPMAGNETVGITATYDAWNRMVSSTRGSNTVTYEYDGLGRLVGRSVVNSFGVPVASERLLLQHQLAAP
ncbi:MAG: hypothetical protein QM770_01305 [Tepidisphaeraceae bacterium]